MFICHTENNWQNDCYVIRGDFHSLPLLKKPLLEQRVTSGGMGYLFQETCGKNENASSLLSIYPQSVLFIHDILILYMFKTKDQKMDELTKHIYLKVKNMIEVIIK